MTDLSMLFDRPIAFQRAFVSLGCGITGALMLSQAVYWARRTADSEGWFYKTGEEWLAETGLTRREQETARARLVAIGVLHEIKRGVPCKVHYKIDFDMLHELCGIKQTSSHKPSKPVCTKAPNSVARKRQTITETTTETTTDIVFAGAKKQSKATPIPSDFSPTAQHSELAIKFGVDLGSELEQFIDYHKAKGSTFKDWHAALRTWIRNSAKLGNARNQKKPVASGIAEWLNREDGEDYGQIG